ncbi:profilin, required for normal timing of actin polymerization in response to thermal stress [Ceratobasidium sp. 428]|nr:profilin, required for normal timing of actin polymerization in response to thermal stress [Ceratobasidium sp. 428]
MSWQGYVDNNLVGSGKVTKGAIVGQQGGVWATSPGFTLSQEEQNKITKLFNDPAAAQSGGVTLAGVKYFAVQADDQKFYGKKAADGCVLVKTKQAILVTVHNAPIQMGESAPVVESVGDYLKSQNY